MKNKYIQIAKLFRDEPVEIVPVESIPENCRWNGIDLKFEDGSYFQICLDDKWPRYRFFDCDLYEFPIPQNIVDQMNLIYESPQKT